MPVLPSDGWRCLYSRQTPSSRQKNTYTHTTGTSSYCKHQKNWGEKIVSSNINIFRCNSISQQCVSNVSIYPACLLVNSVCFGWLFSKVSNVNFLKVSFGTNGSQRVSFHIFVCVQSTKILQPLNWMKEMTQVLYAGPS